MKYLLSILVLSLSIQVGLCQPNNPDPYGFKDYTKFREYIATTSYNRGILVVGPSDPYTGTYQIHCRVDANQLDPVLPNGEYDCFNDNGRPVLQPRYPSPMPRVGTVSQQLFSTPYQMTVYSSFSQRDLFEVQGTSSSCANGQCGIPQQTQTRRGLFRR